MTAPTVEAVDPAAEETVEIVDDTAGEMRVRFPVLVIEGVPTSDDRLIEPDALTHRALPLSLLAQAEASHGGDDPGPAVVIGRLDTLERRPGPEVLSPRTGEPYPEGSFVWSATGVIDANHPIAPLVRKGYLRGVSVDLVGMDYEIVGDDGNAMTDGDWGAGGKLITYSAEIAAATMVPVAAFSDAYGELADEDAPPALPDPDELPDGLMASAVPAWRSREVGDRVPVIVAAEEDIPVRIPPDAVDQLAAVIDSGEERDAAELATALVQHIADNWAADVEEEDPDDELAPGYEPPAVVAAADEGPHTGGMIALVPADPDVLAVEGGDPVEQLHLTLAYLGEDVTGWDDAQRAEVLDVAARIAETLGHPVEAEVMGHAAFNPTGAHDREPCAVYLVSGPDLPTLKAEVAAFDVGDHPVFLPHLTAGYGLDPSALSFVGPVTFNVLRVALGEDVTDIPLGQPADVEEEEPALEPEEIVAAAAPAEQADQPTKERAVTAAVANRPLAALVSAANASPDVYLDEVPSDEGRKRPPLAWFTDPGFTEETPITIDGQRVYGHVAPWNRSHLSFGGKDIYAPRSRCDYSEFLRGAVKATDDDGLTRIVAVGHITAGGPHADMHMSATDTARFYDHSGYSVARIAMGEDQHGIWCAGILNPGATDAQIDALLAHPPSGDWRRVAGHLEMVGVLCVNVPGFGTNRARVASGAPLALVASSGLPPVRVLDSAIDVGALAAAVVDEQERRAVALAAAGLVAELDDTPARHAQMVADLDDTPAVVAALLKEVDDSPRRAAALLAELDEPAGIALDG